MQDARRLHCLYLVIQPDCQDLLTRVILGNRWVDGECEYDLVCSHSFKTGNRSENQRGALSRLRMSSRAQLLYDPLVHGKQVTANEAQSQSGHIYSTSIRLIE